MPLSDADIPDGDKPEQVIAVQAEALYLINLLLLPGLGFLLLLMLYFRHINSSHSLARCHLRQTLRASLWAGFLLIIINGMIIGILGYDAAQTWIIVLIYFTLCHASFVLLGTLGLARAMAGKHFHYPLIGGHCEQR